MIVWRTHAMWSLQCFILWLYDVYYVIFLYYDIYYDAYKLFWTLLCYQADINLAIPGRIQIVALHDEGCNLPQGNPFLFYYLIVHIPASKVSNLRRGALWCPESPMSKPTADDFWKVIWCMNLHVLCKLCMLIMNNRPVSSMYVS